MDHYSTAAAVRARSGVGPEDLGLDTDDDLETFLEDLLREVTDLMDRKMRRSFLDADPVPAGLDGIAADVAAAAVRDMIASRQTPVVRIDDFAVRTITARIFSPDIEKRLRLYARGLGMIDVVPGDLAASNFAEDLDLDNG